MEPLTERASTSSSPSEEDSDDDDIEGIRILPRKRKKLDGEQLEKGHKCRTCQKVFKFPNKLRQHMITHRTGRYSCLVCENVAFDTYNELKAHKGEQHSLESHKCPECSFTARRRLHVDRHFQKNHVDGVPCTIEGCSMRIAKNRIKTHIRQVHSADFAWMGPVRAHLSFEKCPKCEYRPDGSKVDLEMRHDDLMRHMLTKHEKHSKVGCPAGCGEQLQLTSLEAHLKTCTAAIPSGTTSEAPTNTMTSRNSEDTRGDDDDDDVFSDIRISDVEEEATTEAHRQNASTPRGEFRCVQCQKTSKSREALRKHVWSVHNKQKASRRAKEFKCDRPLAEGSAEQCGKAFRTEQALADHFNLHDDVKPYGCISCNQRFHGRDRFAVHLSKYHRTSIKDLNANLQDFGLRPQNQKATALDSVPTEPETSSASDPPDGGMTSSVAHLEPTNSEVMPTTSSSPEQQNPTTSLSEAEPPESLDSGVTSPDAHLKPTNSDVTLTSSTSSPSETENPALLETSVPNDVI